MAEEKMMRLSQVARQLNVGTSTILEVLAQRGFKVENSGNAKITSEQFDILSKEFRDSALEKREASGLVIGKKPENMVIDAARPERRDRNDDDFFVPVHAMEKPVVLPKEEPKPPVVETQPPAEPSRVTLPGVKILGKIELDKKGNPIPPKAQPKPEPVLTPEAKTVEPPVQEPKHVEPVAEPTPRPAEPEPPQKQRPEPPVVKTEPKPSAKPVEKPVAQPKEPVVPPTKVNEIEVVKAKGETLRGLSVVGKIELPTDKDKRRRDSDTSDDDKKRKKRKRKRLKTGPTGNAAPAEPAKATATTDNNNKAKSGGSGKRGKNKREEVSEREVQDQLRATLNKMGGRGGRGKVKSRGRDNREEL
nr:hypothetical protein [Cytophagales bacterium]